MPTHLYDIVDPTAMQAGVDAKLINIRESGDGLSIANYSDAAMWTAGAWDNAAVRACRGIIYDTHTLDVVARPWGKFFNHGQPEAGELDMDAPVEVTDKVDGSLGIIHPRPDGQWAVATRGSFTSDQARHATDLLNRYRFDEDKARMTTLLVEIVYPANRIVCDYGDRDELVLLGSVNIASGAAFGPGLTAALYGWDEFVAQTFQYATLAEALAAPPRPGAEGLVVRYVHEPQRLVKIKQDDYIALHRIVTGLSERTVWQHMTDGLPLTDLLEGLPDELHDWTRNVWYGFHQNIELATSDVERHHDDILDALPDGWTRKDYAEAAKAADLEDPRYLSMLFAHLDGRELTPIILKHLKPRGDTRAKTITEDVA